MWILCITNYEESEQWKICKLDKNRTGNKCESNVDVSVENSLSIACVGGVVPHCLSASSWVGPLSCLY